MVTERELDLCISGSYLVATLQRSQMSSGKEGGRTNCSQFFPHLHRLSRISWGLSSEPPPSRLTCALSVSGVGQCPDPSLQSCLCALPPYNAHHMGKH